MKKYTYTVEISCVEKDACGNKINPPNEREVRMALEKGIDYAETIYVRSVE